MVGQEKEEPMAFLVRWVPKVTVVSQVYPYQDPDLNLGRGVHQDLTDSQGPRVLKEILEVQGAPDLRVTQAPQEIEDFQV